MSQKITTNHNVTVTDRMQTDLTNNRITKYFLIEFSFKYLLDKEPNTSILSSFSIDVILRYFSDYRDKVRQWCDENTN